MWRSFFEVVSLLQQKPQQQEQNKNHTKILYKRRSETHVRLVYADVTVNRPPDLIAYLQTNHDHDFKYISQIKAELFDVLFPPWNIDTRQSTSSKLSLLGPPGLVNKLQASPKRHLPSYRTIIFSNILFFYAFNELYPKNFWLQYNKKE